MLQKNQTLEDQLTTLATVFLAYVAFIPSIRASIPSVSYATLSDYIIYFYLLACVFAASDNVLSRFLMNSNFTYYVALSLTSFLIFFPMLITFILWLNFTIRKTKLDPKFMHDEKESTLSFTTESWTNKEWI
jgi:hypothetical protein